LLLTVNLQSQTNSNERSQGTPLETLHFALRVHAEAKRESFDIWVHLRESAVERPFVG
jgi:hypothetical protein